VDYAGDGTPVRLQPDYEALRTIELRDAGEGTLIERIVDGVIGAVGAACILSMTMLVFCNALSRYLFSNSFIWADEIIVSLMPWLAMSGVYLSIRRRDMIRIDYFVEKLPPRPRRALIVGSQFISAAAFAFLAIGGFQYLAMFGGDTTLYLDLPTGWFTSALLIGAGLVFAAFVIEGVRDARKEA
jgi:TRAP-type C4-dicarboxylate transport system permease small subunit